MDLRLQPGFLGTGASLMSDISLLAYIVLIVPAMLIGFVFARRGMHRPQHKTVMTAITLVNWFLIVFLMIVSYSQGVAPGLPGAIGDPRSFLPTVHLVFGAVAQLLATYILVRMYREDTQVAAAKKRGERDVSRYWFTSAKPVMRITLTLWLLTAALGIGTYFVFYGGGTSATPETPVVTEEPASTPEAGADSNEAEAPAATPEPSG